MEFVLDTNIISTITKDPDNYQNLYAKGGQFYISHMQKDELDRIKSNEHSKKVTEFLDTIRARPTGVFILDYNKLSSGEDDDYMHCGNRLNEEQFYSDCLAYMNANDKKGKHGKFKFEALASVPSKFAPNTIYHVNNELHFSDDFLDSTIFMKYDDINNQLLLKNSNGYELTVPINNNQFKISKTGDIKKLIGKLSPTEAISIGFYNHVIDSIIASTAYVDEMTLVTNDELLLEAANHYKLKAIDLTDLDKLFK